MPYYIIIIHRAFNIVLRRVDNNKRIINLFQSLFGDSNTKNVVLEKSYKEYLEGFTDIATGEARRGFIEVVKDLQDNFPNIGAIETEKDKKEFLS